MKGLDLEKLQAYLDSPPLSGTMFAGGRSNLTYAVTDGVNRWVLRRPPLGHVLPTAHDMAREHKVLDALSKADFPVPKPVLLCTDTEVIGAPFYLMEHVDGTIYRDPAGLSPTEFRELTFTLVDTLADLHALDPQAIGLGDFGKPEGFNARQVRRWKQQLDASRSRELSGIDELHARLATDIPDGAGAVVHGDFRLDNVLVSDKLTVNAVLDWEMSTLGDPLSDLALMLIYAGRPMLERDGVPVAPIDIPGHPTLDEISARYAERSKRDVSDLHWYVGFAAFKLAVILEGVHYRYIKGQTVGPGFDTVGAMVPALVEQGHRALEGN
ncbi:aminoglycoside phosphotransferase (APT) family kinase protein [Actinoplanes campanulatus]|uniref:Aminoglycoside phosphotransferase (APT) family kinase protein n=1 Tax=Actinoplanes campanulatus TaxID=113559 RepID=A0A7W5AJ97_9ACTN|nr:phosphotransferase family protein [Actinoplanes campanulatus]MBB3097303.1 aminoglycoside phosphotransferase (APT) family kinase protein [Actinoplanes campanulatus]GGN17136.1 acyl-CoA dehydrogenase [Actinoplanes campanulatus]GID37514.1 acyl-CoA dehydrogenase [Actinoplanes campanulatus]